MSGVGSGDEDEILGDLDRSMEQAEKSQQNKRIAQKRIKRRSDDTTSSSAVADVVDFEEYDDVVLKEMQDELGTAPAPTKRRLKRLGNKSSESNETNDQFEQSDEEPAPVEARPRRNLRRAPKLTTISEDEYEEESEVESTRRRPHRAAPQQQQAPRRLAKRLPSDLNDFIAEEDEFEYMDNEEEETQERNRSPAKKGPQKKPAKRGSRKPAQKELPSASDSESASAGEQPDEPVSPRRKIVTRSVKPAFYSPLRQELLQIKPSPLLRAVKARLKTSSSAQSEEEQAPDADDNDSAARTAGEEGDDAAATEAPSSPSKSVLKSPRKGRGDASRKKLVLDLVSHPQQYKDSAMQEIEDKADDVNGDIQSVEDSEIYDKTPFPIHEDEDLDNDFIQQKEYRPPRSQSKVVEPSRTTAAKPKRQMKLVSLDSLKKKVPQASQSPPSGTLRAVRGKLSFAPAPEEDPDNWGASAAMSGISSQKPTQSKPSLTQPSSRWSAQTDSPSPDDPVLKKLQEKYASLDRKIACIAEGATQQPKAKESSFVYDDSDEESKEEEDPEKVRMEQELKRMRAQIIVHRLNADDKDSPDTASETKSKSKHQVNSLYASSQAPAAPENNEDEVQLVIEDEDVGQEQEHQSHDDAKSIKKRKREDEAEDDIILELGKSDKSSSIPRKRAKRIDSYFTSSPTKAEEQRAQSRRLQKQSHAEVEHEETVQLYGEEEEEDDDFATTRHRSESSRARARDSAREWRDETKRDLADASGNYEDDPDLDGFIAPDDEVEEWSGGDLPDESDREGEEEDEDEASEDDISQLTNPFITVNLTMRQAMEIFIQILIMGTIAPDEATDALRAERPGTRSWYYKPAIKKVRDNILEKGSNIMASSAWQTGFERDLRSLPRYHSAHGGGFTDTCQACKRRNHVTSFTVKLGGVRYDPLVLWNMDFENINAFFEECEAPGAEEEEQIYYLGSFCHKRTSIYHRVLHFPYQLLKKIRKKISMIEKQNPDIAADELMNDLLSSQNWMESLVNEWRQVQEDLSDFFRKEVKENL